MDILSYTTTDGTPDKRASFFFRDPIIADAKMKEQNEKAEHMKIEVRYQIATCSDEGIAAKDIR